MNWEAIGAVAETVGVVMIIVSLIYMAAQIRQNTHEVTRSIDATRLAAFERNIESGNRIREWLAKQDLDWRPEFRIFVDERVAALGTEEKDRV